MSEQDLKGRVNQFNAMKLPGQPMGMHMGTSYLVNDLWREVERLRAVALQCDGCEAEITRIARRNTHSNTSSTASIAWNQAVSTMQAELIDAIRALRRTDAEGGGREI